MNLENFCSRELQNIILPSTLIKLAIHHRFFRKVADSTEKLSPRDGPEVQCSFCKGEKLCKKHSCLEKVTSAEKICFDSDTCFFLFRDVVFRMCKDHLLIVWCKNIKRIRSRVSRVKDYTIFTFRNTSIPLYEEVLTFNLREVLKQHPTFRFGNNFELKMYSISGILVQIFKDGIKVDEIIS